MTAPQDPFATPSGEPTSTPPAGQPGGFSQPAPYAQPAPFGQPDSYGQPGQAPRNGLGTAALVLGLLALLTCWTVLGGLGLGLLAVVLGALGRGRAKRREATNGGMALTGIILGVISILLAGALIAFLASDTGTELRRCISDAVTQAEIDQCSQDAVNRLTT